MKYKKIISFFFTLIIFALISSSIAFAADPCINGSDKLCFVPAITIPGFSTAGISQGIDGSSLAKYIVAIYRYGAMFAGVIAMFILVYAGWQWLLAGGNSGKISQARDKINGALIGLTLLFGGYILLSLISTNLVKFKPLKTALPDAKVICSKILEEKACTANTLCHWNKPVDGQEISLTPCIAKSEVPLPDPSILYCSKIEYDGCFSYFSNTVDREKCNENFCYEKLISNKKPFKSVCYFKLKSDNSGYCESLEKKDCETDDDCRTSVGNYFCKSNLFGRKTCDLSQRIE